MYKSGASALPSSPAPPLPPPPPCCQIQSAAGPPPPAPAVPPPAPASITSPTTPAPRKHLASTSPPLLPLPRSPPPSNLASTSAGRPPTLGPPSHRLQPEHRCQVPSRRHPSLRQICRYRRHPKEYSGLAISEMDYLLSQRRIAQVSRRRNIIRTLLGFLPQVQRPNQPIPHCVKYFYTVASVSIFMAASQLPLYGVQPAPRGPDPLYWARLPFAANWGTLMTFGILPVILPEAIVHVLGRPALNMNCIYTEDRTILDGAQKLVGIFITILIAIGFALFSVILDKVGTAVALLIMLQVFFSGVAVIYLDEVLKKGYGLLPSTSLFTATNICASVMWKAFSPGYVINLLSACLFCLIAIFVQGFSVVLPMRSDCIHQVNYRLKLSHISYAPIIFQRVVLLLMVSISEMLYVIFGESSPVNLFGKWKESNTPFEKSSPFSGIIYYLTAPPTLVDWQRDPLHAFLYISIVLYTCPVFSAIWFRVCMTSRTFYNGLLGANGEPRLTRAQPDSIPRNEFWSYIYGAASLGGLCVGALIVLADFVGVAGSGTGIMLAVTAVSRYFEGWKAEQPGILGL